MNSRIALLVPTRERVAGLARLIQSIADTADKPDDVVLVVGVDDDDAPTREFAGRCRSRVEIFWSVGPRELTLGRLWNRLAAGPHDCDILAMFTDDYVMATRGWDQQYRRAASVMPFGFGTAWPIDPLHPPNFCTAPVITRRMMERMGFFVPPWFPYWFHDIWLEEVGAFVACRLPLPARMAAPDGRGLTRGMRDLAFWAQLFDATRPLRLQLAHRLLDEMYAGQEHLKVSLRFAMQGVAMFYQRRMSSLADPARAAVIEQRHAAAGEPSTRYLAARKEAESLIASLHRPTS
ncbi:MAG: hypothetical protein ABI920_18170 [Casimicrobiaceae bacterium]